MRRAQIVTVPEKFSYLPLSESVNVVMPSIEPKPGDTILTTHPTGHLDIWFKFVAKEVRDPRFSQSTRFMYGDGYILYLEDNAFKVIESSDTLAKIGDKIIVTNSSLPTSLGEERVVVKCPSDKTDFDQSDRIWTRSGGDKEVCWLYRKSFEIMKRSVPTALVSCSDCHGTGTIELLTSIAKCRCRDITVEQE